MTTLQVSKPSSTTELVEKKKRQKKVKISEPILDKLPPQSTDYVIVLIRLEDGRVLAIGDKKSGDEQIFKKVLDKNAASLFNLFQVDLAEDIAKYMPENHVFYISEILI